MLRQQLFGIRANQKVHVGTCDLLGRVGFKFSQKRAGMRGVDDDQLPDQMG